MSQLARTEDIVVPFEKYQSNGQEKTAFRNIGEIITFKRDDGTYSKIMKLWTMPNVQIKIFERKPKEQRQTTPKAEVAPVQPQEEEINIEDIPF